MDWRRVAAAVRAWLAAAGGGRLIARALHRIRWLAKARVAAWAVLSLQLQMRGLHGVVYRVAAADPHRTISPNLWMPPLGMGTAAVVRWALRGMRIPSYISGAETHPPQRWSRHLTDIQVWG
jgi:hypothetical protein